MTIMIAGDSWGCGEWKFHKGNYYPELLHKGLEQYLVDDGHNVINVSKGGISNLDIINRMQKWAGRYRDVAIDKVFVFQTEFSRDFKHREYISAYDVDDWNISTVDELISIWIERFYHRLSEFAQSKNCKVYLLGGVADTMWFDNMENDYPGCSIACQSVTSLLISNNSRVSQPVFSWLTSDDELLVSRLKQSTDIAKLLDQINLGVEREATLAEHPKLFFPDGRHPNRHGYKILFNFLKENQFI
jgi:hypothetical protein